MGMEMVQSIEESRADTAEDASTESRPSILLVGAAAVGKTTILNRLRQNTHASTKSAAGATCYGWKIDTKYYTANVGIWMARLEQAQEQDLSRLQSLSDHCEALVMVFDLSNDASFDCLKSWATRTDLGNYEILLCVGNKADRVPDHYGHIEYRRRLQRRGESSSDPHPEFLEYGIQRTEGSALLNGEDAAAPLDEKRHSRMEWCVENGIEYIEACALDEAFDECLSLDGDLQGVLRVQGALSAHMWQGMVMKPSGKPGNTDAVAHSRDLSSDEESNFTIEYELLSNGSADEGFAEEDHHSESIPVEFLQREEAPNGDTAANGEGATTRAAHTEVAAEVAADANGNEVNQQQVAGAAGVAGAGAAAASATSRDTEMDEKNRLDEFEHLMQEMAGIRDNLRMMPDAQRREMASQIAMRMASMFMDGEDDANDSDDE